MSRFAPYLPQSEKRATDNEKKDNYMGDNSRQIVVLNVMGSSPIGHPNSKRLEKPQKTGMGTIFRHPLIIYPLHTFQAIVPEINRISAPNMPRKPISL